MIQLDGVTKAYGRDLLLDNVSFTLGKKERCGLVGRNGSGKTTLFRLISGQEEPDSGCITFPKNYSLGYLSQHIHFSQKTLLVEACLGLKDEEKEMTYKAEAILFGLGFQKHDLTRSPSDFSGGYQLRLHLAKLLLSEPDCLLLDEPTNYLDILSIRWLQRFLSSWPGEFLIVSHDRQFLDSVTTHTLGIVRSRLRKVEGPSSKLFEQIAAEEEIHEKTRLAIEKKREHMQSFVDRFGSKNTKAGQAQSKLKAINRLPSLAALCQINNLQFSFPALDVASKILLGVNGLSFSYSESSPLLISELSLEIEKEARIGIIGPNGMGKSTLLKLLVGELKASKGHIKTINGLTIGYFGQSHIDRLNPQLSIEEEIKKTNPTLSFQEIRSIAGKMMFQGASAEKKIGVLSGGERSRVVLAKILSSPCHLLLLDEPTNHLDVESMEAFIDALEDFPGAVILVTHSELVLQRVASQLVVFKNGKQELFLGTYTEFLEKGGWGEQEKPLQVKEQPQKVLKALRANLVNDRSRALKPHLQRIEEIEAKIISLEAEVEKINSALLDAATQNKASAIPELTRTLKEKQKDIDLLFAELDTKYQLTVAIRADFEVKFAELET